MPDDSTLFDPAMPDALAAGLTASASFHKQTVERVNNMKFLVLKAFEALDSEEEGGNSPAHQQTRKDITTKIVSLVEGRAEAVEQFKKSQEAAEFTLSNLRRRLVGLQTEYDSQSRGAKLEASKQDRDLIVKHVTSVERTRQEQIEAENTLHTLLELKHKVQAQDSHALRISQETIMMTQRAPEVGRAEAALMTVKAAANAVPGSPVVVRQNALSPQGKSFQEGQQVSFVKVGKNGWTLVRDESGHQCWLATEHLDFSSGGSNGTPNRPDLDTSQLGAMSPEVKQATNAVVGIALGLGEHNAIVIAGVKPGAPAHRSRMIAPGDQLLRLDGKMVSTGMELKSVVQLLCGPVGSIVCLGVKKVSGDELDVVLVREQPSTSLHSSLSQTPGSPGESSMEGKGLAIRPVQQDSFEPREGPIHNVYSSQESLPPSAAVHGRHPTHHHRHHPSDEVGVAGALAHMNLSNVEPAPDMVYRAGPSPQQQSLDRIDPHAPIVWPIGSEAPGMALHEMAELFPLMQPPPMPEQRLQRLQAAATMATLPPMVPPMQQRTSPHNSPPAMPAAPAFPKLPNPFAAADALRPDGISEIGMPASLQAGMGNVFNASTEMMGMTEIGMANYSAANHHNPFRKAPNFQQPGMGRGMMMVMGGGAPTPPENQLMGNIPAGLERYGSPYRTRHSGHSGWQSFMSPSARAP